jgi:hypothetical protein
MPGKRTCEAELIDPRQSDVRRGEFLGKRRLGEDHHYADKQKAFQTIVPRSARS